MDLNQVEVKFIHTTYIYVNKNYLSTTSMLALQKNEYTLN